MLQRVILARRSWPGFFSGSVGALVGSMLLGFFVSAPAAAFESRSFVMSEFALATNPTDHDCPASLETIGSPMNTAHASLLLQGYSAKEADRLAQAFDDVLVRNNTNFKEIERQFADFTTRRARVDGKPVDTYLNPAAAPNPGIPEVANRMQYGFNLDGKGQDDPNSIEDPETHERGVDNQYARAVGCMTPYRFKTFTGSGPDAGYYWNENRPTRRATLITVAGDDLSKDGRVFVLVRRSLDAPLLNAKGEPQPDATFRIDPDRRALNIFRAELKNGVVNSLEPIDFWMMGDPESDFDYKLMRSRFRIELNPNGTASGMVGGYRPWRDIYAPYVTVGSGWEFMGTFNLVAVWDNLRDYADGMPDKDGHNTAISSAWKFEAVPAFVVGADGTPESAQTLQSYEALFAAQQSKDYHRPYLAGVR